MPAIAYLMLYFIGPTVVITCWIILYLITSVAGGKKTKTKHNPGSINDLSAIPNNTIFGNGCLTLIAVMGLGMMAGIVRDFGDPSTVFLIAIPIALAVFLRIIYKFISILKLKKYIGTYTNNQNKVTMYAKLSTIKFETYLLLLVMTWCFIIMIYTYYKNKYVF